MFNVTMTNNGVTYYLRSTVWTSFADRADKYPSKETALAAIDKSRMFNPKAAKLAKIVAVA